MRNASGLEKRGLNPRKRAAIEAAARSLFMANGYRAVSMEEVAREANVSKATLYNHFPDKMALFAGVVEQLRTSYIMQVPPDVADSIGQFEDFLIKFGINLLNLLHGDELRTFNQMVGAYAHEMPDLVRTIYDNGPLATQRLLADAFQLAMDRGLLQRRDPMLMADQFLSLVRGVAFTEAMWGIHKPVSPQKKKAHVKASTEVILAAYGTDGKIDGGKV